MAELRNAWNNFKVQPEIWFFYAFLATSMLSVRKVLSDFFIAGAFNEYTGRYIYLSDLFLIATLLILGVSILYNKYYNSSIVTFLAVPPQKESSTWNFLRGRPGTEIALLALPALLAIWSSITIFWTDQPQIAAYRSFKLFEFYLLYLFLAFHPRCSTWNILKNLFRIIIFIGLINALIGILQVIIQHSLGLFWLRESLISPNLPGIAKIILGGTKYIRAYGLFPHPNILGGFLFLSILLTLIHWRLFNSSTIVPRETFLPEWKMPSNTSRYIFGFIIGTQILAGILTFSKSATLGFIFALTYLFGRFAVPRGTIRRIFMLIIFSALVIYLVQPDFGSIFIKSLAERLVYIDISLNMISGNFLAGIGSGQFVFEMQNYSKQILSAWQFQPVHNVFLLIWSELGLIGLSLFGWFIWKLFRFISNVSRLPRETTLFHVEQSSFLLGGTFWDNQELQTTFKALLIGFFVIALFDHYLWDIQQGQIMLWLVLGLLTGNRLNT